jgi:hypothetical protein
MSGSPAQKCQSALRQAERNSALSVVAKRGGVSEVRQLFPQIWAPSNLVGGAVGLYVSQLPAFSSPAAPARLEYGIRSFWKRFNLKR